MPEDALCVVQFIHPGGEHRPDAPGIKRWNQGRHQRKFMRSAGAWLDAAGRVRNGDLVFWGEWEPPSTVQALDTPSPDHPQYLHHPFLEPRTEFGDHQNTDPFVFGDQFLYTGCQQWRGKPRGYPVQLRRLLPGSVILFGSAVRYRFLLDTVLVVRDFIDHHRGDRLRVLKGAVPAAYWTVTLGPWYAGPDDERSWRLYRGADPDDPIKGMFSFFPCLSVNNLPTQGFVRPDISALPGVNPRLRQGWSATKLQDATEAVSVWKAAREQVMAQGCQLGVRAAIPRAHADEQVRLIHSMESAFRAQPGHGGSKRRNRRKGTC